MDQSFSKGTIWNSRIVIIFDAPQRQYYWIIKNGME